MVKSITILAPIFGLAWLLKKTRVSKNVQTNMLYAYNIIIIIMLKHYHSPQGIKEHQYRTGQVSYADRNPKFL